MATTTPTTTETSKDAAKKSRPLIFDRPEKFSDTWIDKELLVALAISLGKGEGDRRGNLLAAIKFLNPKRDAQHWALERTVVEAAIRKGDRKMAALKELARSCRMPTLRVRSNGKIISRGERAVELLTAVVKSDNPRLAARWREMRALLVTAGWSMKDFTGVSNSARALETKRQSASLDRAVKGERSHRGSKRSSRKRDKK